MENIEKQPQQTDELKQKMSEKEPATKTRKYDKDKDGKPTNESFPDSEHNDLD